MAEVCIAQDIKERFLTVVLEMYSQKAFEGANIGEWSDV